MHFALGTAGYKLEPLDPMMVPKPSVLMVDEKNKRFPMMSAFQQ
jgi:hypothetical protein